MIIVERATEEDIPHLIDIDQQVARKPRVSLIVEGVKNRQIRIAKDGEESLGYAYFHQQFFSLWFIELVITHPAHQRKGVATALIQYIVKTCPNDRIFTSTNESNLAAQALLENSGFIKSGYIENLDDGDPELIYCRRIVR